MSSNMSDWKQSTILGKNRPMLGETAVRQLAVWVRMSRLKHDWQREVHGDEHIVVDALQSELDELRHAVKRHDPTEHIMSEILDLICVAWRYLIGEHCGGNDARFRAWVKELENIKPTEPGEVSPYDEHKEGSEYERNGSRSYSERREEEVGHDYGMRCERCGRHLCLDESANGGLCHACLEKAALEDEEKRPPEKVMPQDEVDALLRGEVIKAKPEISTDEAVTKLHDDMTGDGKGFKNAVREGMKSLPEIMKAVENMQEKRVVTFDKPEMDSNGYYTFPHTSVIEAERGKALFDAIKIINGDRQEKHGKPEDSFGIIASLWNGYLDGLAKSQDPDPEYYPLTFPTLKPQHVAQMMALMKVARTLNNAAVHDSHVDALGYLALAADMEEAEA